MLSSIFCYTVYIVAIATSQCNCKCNASAKDKREKDLAIESWAEITTLALMCIRCNFSPFLMRMMMIYIVMKCLLSIFNMVDREVQKSDFQNAA